MKPIRVCCAIIYFPDNKILAVQRSRTMNQGGKWEFPGGKIEDGESEEECIIREIREELGIEIKITGTLASNIHKYETFIIELIPFIAKHISGNISLREHSDYWLLDKTDLLNPEWAAADIPIVKQITGL